MSDDEEDFHREFERARLNDGGRSRKQVRAIPPTPSEGYTRCMDCGSEGARMRVTPEGGKLVCTGVFEEQPAGPPIQVDCYDRWGRAQALRNGEEYRETKRVILGAKERGCLTDEDRRFLRSICGGQESIDALEKRFERNVEKGGRPKLKAGDW